jgi:outer membrane lipoprotein-sorting protein
MILQNSLISKTAKYVIFCLILINAFHQSEARTLTVDQIIQKNIEVSGGADNWAKVKNIKMTGTYTSFSNPESFTIWRERPDKYRFDCKRLSFFTIHAYDGKKAWWVNPLMGPPHDMPGEIPSKGNLDLVTLRERVFEPVFWNYQKKGNQVELIGKENLDGEEVYNLKVTLKDGAIEHWFINAETFLVVSMTGYTYDFGKKCKLETFFSDYRKVEGLILPFLIESEYSTRYRTWEVDKIELNTTFKSMVFEMPDPAKWKKK